VPRTISTFSSGCALLTALACSSPERDLGRTSDAAPPNAMRMSECEDPGQADKLQAPRARFLSDFVGLWLGDAEDALGDVGPDDALPIYAFPSGSTRILLQVARPRQIAATLTFGEGEPPSPTTDPNLADLSPTEGFAYSAEPITSALDVERSGGDVDLGKQPAADGKLVLAFSIDDVFISELHVRFAGDRLVGVFDGLSLINERGFLTRPGRVRFRPLTGATEPSE
jgi:hypothetical protein